MKRILAVLLTVMLLAAVVSATSVAETVSNATTYKVYRVSYCNGRLGLREGAGNDYDVVAKLCNGKPLKLIRKCGSWYNVKTFDGVCGWVNKKNVKCGAYANVNTSSKGLNYRKGPGMGYAVIDSFAKGTKHLLATKVSGSWAYVSKGSKKGWSKLDLLKWCNR